MAVLGPQCDAIVQLLGAAGLAGGDAEAAASVPFRLRIMSTSLRCPRVRNPAARTAAAVPCQDASGDACNRCQRTLRASRLPCRSLFFVFAREAFPSMLQSLIPPTFAFNLLRTQEVCISFVRLFSHGLRRDRVSYFCSFTFLRLCTLQAATGSIGTAELAQRSRELKFVIRVLHMHEMRENGRPQ